MTSGRILVTGATGFVGRRVVERFASEGRRVVVAGRRVPDAMPSAVETVSVGPLDGATEWTAALRGVELVVHCAAHIPSGRASDAEAEAQCRVVNHEATASLARAAAHAGVRRFLFLSSIKVHGEATPADRGFDENSPLRPEDAYGRSKRDAESALRAVGAESGMETVILRPPLVYGAHAKGNIAALLRLVCRGIPLPLGAVTENRRSLVAVENLVDAIGTCADHPDAAHQTFTVADDEAVSTADLLRRLARAAGRPTRLMPVPPLALRLGATLLGRPGVAHRLLGSLRVETGGVKARLGWRPVVTLDEGLRLMAMGG